MALLLAILPLVIVLVMGGAVVLWALSTEEEVEEQVAEVQQPLSLKELSAESQVMFQPMPAAPVIEQLPTEDLVARLEQELERRRQEAEAYSESLHARPEQAA